MEKIIRKFSPVGLSLNDLSAILKSVQEDNQGKKLFVRATANMIVIIEESP